jgi:hypothetical protein
MIDLAEINRYSNTLFCGRILEEFGLTWSKGLDLGTINLTTQNLKSHPEITAGTKINARKFSFRLFF